MKISSALTWRLVDIGALLTLTAGVGIFLWMETLLPARLILILLTVVAVVLVRTGRDKLLWVLTSLYLSASILFSLWENDVLPIWAILIILTSIVTLLFGWLSEIPVASDWLKGLGVAMLAVELTWFVLPWPFDAKSKAALVALFFYSLWAIYKGNGAKGLTRRGWLSAAFWLMAMLVFVLVLAQWYQ